MSWQNRPLIQSLIDRIKAIKSRTGSQSRLSAVLGSVILALLLWFMAKMNQETRADFELPIKIVGMPPFMELVEAPRVLKINCSGKGRDLWALARTKDSIHIPWASNRFALYHQKDHIQTHLPDGVSLHDVQPDSIVLYTTNRVYKRVPLLLATRLETDPGYHIEKASILEPDSVTLIGPEEMLDSIYHWPTADPKRYIGAKNGAFELPIKTSKALKVAPAIAHIQVASRLYTQVKTLVHVQVKATPPGYQVFLSHNQITLDCLAPMAGHDSLAQEYRLDIPFSSLRLDIDHLVPACEQALPAPLKIITRSPLDIHYRIVKKSDPNDGEAIPHAFLNPRPCVQYADGTARRPLPILSERP